MKFVYYVGFYHGKNCKYRKKCDENIAGSMKMDFIISSLKKLGYKVILLSISIDNSGGYKKEERIVVDEQEEHIYLPYFSMKLGRRKIGAVDSAIRALYRFGKKNFKKDDKVIVYHSLAYGNVFKKLHKKCDIKLITQVEELYCLSVLDQQNKDFVEKEEAMFMGSDGLLLINDVIVEQYAKDKPYAVSYGNYKVFTDKEIRIDDQNVGIVYTGIINEDRGIFRLIEAMKYLPQKYTLHVLGFGSDNHMERFQKAIRDFNHNQVKERIIFYGTKTGKEYTDFLSNYQIGVSLMDTSNEIGMNAFPSKIMAYLGHSLLVVSSKSECIVKSKVADVLYLCENNPEDIAKTIESIPVGVHMSPSNHLRELENQFINDLDNVLKTV